MLREPKWVGGIPCRGQEAPQRALGYIFHAPRASVKPITDHLLQIQFDMPVADNDSSESYHELNESFFELSVDLLCCLDFNGHFKRLNPAWERTLGFTIAELKSRPFLEFVHPDDRERTLSQNR